MKNKSKLAFKMLAKEMEVIELSRQSEIQGGGTIGDNIGFKIDSNGPYLYDSTSYQAADGSYYNKVSTNGSDWTNVPIGGATVSTSSGSSGSANPLTINNEHLPTNWGGADVKKDSEGDSYYRDNAGRVHYIADTGALWDALKSAGTDLAAGFGALKDLFGAGGSVAGAAAGAGYGTAFSVESQMLGQWWGAFGNKQFYMGSDGQEHQVSFTPIGTQPTGFTPTGSEPTGSEPTGFVPTGS
jgi:hypothetical protein